MRTGGELILRTTAFYEEVHDPSDPSLPGAGDYRRAVSLERRVPARRDPMRIDPGSQTLFDAVLDDFEAANRCMVGHDFYEEPGVREFTIMEPSLPDDLAAAALGRELLEALAGFITGPDT